MITHYIATGIGGALGAMSRLLVSKIIPNTVLGIPAQISFINILGCFTIGALAELMALYWSPTDNMRYFLIPGFLGGFTTFSAFALEFGTLIERNDLMLSFLYLSLSVLLSLVFFFIGIRLVRLF